VSPLRIVGVLDRLCTGVGFTETISGHEKRVRYCQPFGEDPAAPHVCRTQMSHRAWIRIPRTSTGESNSG